MPCILSLGFSGILSGLGDLPLRLWAHLVRSETAVCEWGAMFQKLLIQVASGLETVPKKSSKASFVSSSGHKICCCLLYIIAMNSLSKPWPKDHYENVWIARTPCVKGFPSFLTYEIQVRSYTMKNEEMTQYLHQKANNKFTELSIYCSLDFEHSYLGGAERIEEDGL